MEKKEFEKPELIVVLFTDDVIRTSDPFWGGDDEPGMVDNG